MLSEQEIKNKVMTLQSAVASYDEILDRNTTKENPKLCSDLMFRKCKTELVIRALEWTLEREPSL